MQSNKLEHITESFKSYFNYLKKSFKKDGNTKDEVKFDIGITDIKKAYTNIPKKIGWIVGGVSLFVMVILTVLTVNQNIADIEEKQKIVSTKDRGEDIEISMDEQAWKHYQSKRIDEVSEKVQKDLKATQDNIVTVLEGFKVDINKTLNDNQKIAKSNLEEMNKKFQEYKTNFDEKITSTLKSIDEKIKSVKKPITDNNHVSINLNQDSVLLPPPLKNLKTFEPKVLQPKSSVKKAQSTSEHIEPIKKEEYINPDDDEYNFEDISIDSENIVVTDIQTVLYTQTLKDNNSKNPLAFHIMKGMTKATLLTGVNAPTFGGGNNKNPAPILFSIDGSTIIANYDDEVLEDCLVSGSATGNVNTGKADVLLTDISCSGYDKDGNRIKIEQAIKGWALGEDGSFGLDGRIVDSSGKVITKMIALDIIKSLTTAFVLSSQQTNTNIGLNGLAGTTTPFQPNYTTSAQNGLGTGIQRGVDHIYEHYNEVLTGMYPTISVRAGKKVTILFKGGEDVNPTGYKKVDILEEFEVEKNK